MLSRLKNMLNNKTKRDAFVASELAKIAAGLALLDAGCGSQQYRPLCSHLKYAGQDFAQYERDATDGFTSGLGGEFGYQYGKLDYVGNIWAIQEKDQSFDAILCTEVFEHIPYPIETLGEFSRLTRPGGKLILTLPSNCLRHMDPYFFYSGFSNRFLEKFLADSGFDVLSLEQVGDYYSWMMVELARTMKEHSVIAVLLLLPAFLWYLLRKPTAISRSSLCMGYHVVAQRRAEKPSSASAEAKR